MAQREARLGLLEQQAVWRHDNWSSRLLRQWDWRRHEEHSSRSSGQRDGRREYQPSRSRWETTG
jgi:hypothetical protein